MSEQESVQEPVAWMLPGTDSFLTAALKKHHGVRAESYRTPLYTTPPAAPVQREHVTDKSCWCQPALDYKDPDTGAEVWVHNEPH